MAEVIFILGWVSFVLAISSYVCGSIAMIRGPARPHLISRFFWLMLSITNLLSYINIGAGSGIYLALANALGSATIFVLSIRLGEMGFKRSDIVTIVGSFAALLCYIFIPIKLISLVAGLLTHLISGIPTYKKTWKNPDSESFSFWFLFAIASACSLIAVILQNKNVVYPLYFLLFDAGMTVLIFSRSIHKKGQSRARQQAVL